MNLIRLILAAGLASASGAAVAQSSACASNVQGPGVLPCAAGDIRDTVTSTIAAI